MIPIKTEMAQDELKHRRHGLTPVERQILILCNGTRSMAEIADLMGPQAAAQLECLTALGFLRIRAAVRPESAPRAPSSVREPELPRVSAKHAVARPQLNQQKASGAAPGQRRSLVMARMYLFDMMERILGHQSDVVRQHLRAAASEEQLGIAIVDCLQLLVELAEASVALRVARQLAEMIPLEQPQLITQVQAVARPLGVAA